MGHIIVKNAVKRESGFLYYVDKDGSVCRTPMKHKGAKKKTKVIEKSKNEKTKNSSTR